MRGTNAFIISPYTRGEAHIYFVLALIDEGVNLNAAPAPNLIIISLLNCALFLMVRCGVMKQCDHKRLTVHSEPIIKRKKLHYKNYCEEYDFNNVRYDLDLRS